MMMKRNNIKLRLFFAMVVTLFGLVACGNLSNEDSVWNQTREREIESGETSGAQNVVTQFNPGTYEATSSIEGYGGSLTVEVTIGDDGAISNIVVTNHNESEDWYNRAVPALIDNIINTQSADVDAISGATYTSNAFIDAVRIALEKAQ